MALEKVSDHEVFSTDGYRIKFGSGVVSYILGTRYLTIPTEQRDGATCVYRTRSSPWMEYGQPCDTEGTLSIMWLRSQITAALLLLERPYLFE
jgi:hypothetical protein